MSTPWEIPRLWHEIPSPVFVLAGGPSLYGLDPSLLSGHRIIAVNNAYSLYPNADFLVFCDLAWWQIHRRYIKPDFKGQIVSIANTRDPWVMKISNMGKAGLSRYPKGVCHGRHSGYQAINLAYLLGGNPIIGLGFDFKVWTWADAADHGSYIDPNSSEADFRIYQAQQRIKSSPGYSSIPHSTHCHTGHGGPAHNLDILLRDVMLPPMRGLIQELNNDGVRFINCSPRSRMTFAEFQPLQAVLEQYSDHRRKYEHGFPEVHDPGRERPGGSLSPGDNAGAAI